MGNLSFFRAAPGAMLLFSALGCAGQSGWAEAAIPGRVLNIQQVRSSPNNDRIYYAGMIKLDSTGWQNTNPVLRYSNGDWDTLGILRQIVYSMVEHNDTLIATGGFDMVDDSLPVDHIAYWNGQHWKPYGSFQVSGGRKLRVIDDTLYAVGWIDSADGQNVNGIVRRVGGHWEPVGSFVTDFGENIVGDILQYDGRLIVLGTGVIGGERGVYRLENGNWTVLGGGIQGGLCSAECMAVYHGDLYVGGQITMACGNPGQGIMRWDGSAWQPVELGLQYALGDNSSFAGASDMVVHNDLLYVCGGFRFAGGVEARGIATWNGTEWCGVVGNFSDGTGHTGAYRMDFYHDTLFVAANMVDGDSVNFAAKFIGTNYTDTCAVVPNPVAQAPAPSVWSIAPNPATERVRLKLPADLRAPITVHNASGALVLRTSAPVRELDVRGWPRGLYLVRCGDLPAQRLVLE